MSKYTYHLLVVTLATPTLIYACEHQENVNCTDDGVTKQYLLEEHSSRSNLAWLVTPALFALGVFYLIYKCCRDGLCNCQRLRQRAALEHQEEQGYIPLNEVALFSTSQIPCTHPGVQGSQGPHQLVLVHNQSFCLHLDGPPHRSRGTETHCHVPVQSRPPTYQEALLHGGNHNVGTAPEIQVVTNPPSYISSKPPRYSVAMGEASPHPSVSEDGDPDIIVVSERPRQLKYVSNRRRHRSAQDNHMKHDRRRHCSAQDKTGSEAGETDNIRQRCFSFNALKDAFKRSQQNMPECESLLSQDENNSVFSSREVVSSPGPSTTPLTFVTTSVITTRVQRRPPQQVSFEDRILEDSESNESIEQQRSNLNHTVDARLRQRHFSAPGSSQPLYSKSRHSSGNS